jgi:hypothetical protein
MTIAASCHAGEEMERIGRSGQGEARGVLSLAHCRIALRHPTQKSDDGRMWDVLIRPKRTCGVGGGVVSAKCGCSKL